MQKVKLIKPPYIKPKKLDSKIFAQQILQYTITFDQPGSQACEFLSISR